MISDEQQESLDDRKKRVEIDKMTAEANKLRIETEELIRTTRQPFFLKNSFLKPIVAGLLGVPLMWFYYQNVVQPSMESIDAERKSEVAVSRMKSIEFEQNGMRRQIAQELTKLQDLYNELGNSKVMAETDKSKFKQKAEEIQMKIDDFAARSVTISDSGLAVDRALKLRYSYLLTINRRDSLA